MARYQIYKWTKEDLESYEETYGEELEINNSLTQSIQQYGTLVKEVDTENEAFEVCEKAQRDVGYNGLTSIYDIEEREWFN